MDRYHSLHASDLPEPCGNGVAKAVHGFPCVVDASSPQSAVQQSRKLVRVAAVRRFRRAEPFRPEVLTGALGDVIEQAELKQPRVNWNDADARIVLD